MFTVRKYFLILCVTVLFYINASAQGCNIVFYGTIRDANTQVSLPGAGIRLLNEQKNALTDSDGHFHINKICSGNYQVEVSYLGYNKKTFPVTITKDTELDIFLSVDRNQLTEIRIVSKLSQEPVYTAQTLKDRDYELSKGESLGESLKRIPGVNSIQTGPTISKPVIHGMHSNRILIYNAGVRLEGQQWGNEHAPEVDPFLAKDITVIKGAAGVEYGSDALGGIILLNPDQLNYHRPISYEVNMLGASNSKMGLISGKIGGSLKNENFAWRLQGTVKKSGNASTSNYYMDNTGAEEVNGSLNLGYKKKTFDTEVFLSTFNTKLGIFKGAHIGSIEDLETIIANGRPFSDGSFSYNINVPRQEVHHHIAKIKMRKLLDDNASLNLNYSFQKNQRQEYDLRRGDKTDLPALDLNLTAQNLELSYLKNESNDSYTKYGINTSLIINNNIPGTNVTPLIPNYDSFNPALFFIKKMAFKNAALEGGIRYDYKTIDAAGYNREGQLYGGKHNFHNISLSAGSLFHVKPYLDFKSDFNLAWRPPSVNELYSNGLHHGTASIEIGDKSLASEKGYKWVNTLSLIKGAWQTDISGYMNYIKDYIFLQPNGTFVETLRGAFPVFEYKQTDATFIGADLSNSYSLNRNIIWQLKASMVRAKDVRNNRFLPFIPTDKVSNALIWNIRSSDTKIKNPFLTVEHNYVAKQHRYEPSSDFAPPPASYHLFSFSGGISYELNGQTLGFSASVFNLFNTNYKDYLNRFRYYTYDTGRNLVIRLSYKF